MVLFTVCHQFICSTERSPDFSSLRRETTTSLLRTPGSTTQFPGSLIDEKATQFSELIPENKLSTASLLEYLLNYRSDPSEAVDGVNDWIAKNITWYQLSCTKIENDKEMPMALVLVDIIYCFFLYIFYLRKIAAWPEKLIVDNNLSLFGTIDRSSLSCRYTLNRVLWLSGANAKVLTTLYLCNIDLLELVSVYHFYIKHHAKSVKAYILCC